MTSLVLLVLATFWVWETLRAFLRLLPEGWFNASRLLHPVLAAAFPLWVLWPDYVTALGVAGAAGILVAVADRVFDTPAPTQVPLRRRAGLPPLP